MLKKREDNIEIKRVDTNGKLFEIRVIKNGVDETERLGRLFPQIKDKPPAPGLWVHVNGLSTWLDAKDANIE